MSSDQPSRTLAPGQPENLTPRLQRVAVHLVLGKSVTEDAIVLASDLLAAGFDTAATTEVAVLSAGSAWSDAERPVRAMLEEQGISLADVAADDYAAMLRASWRNDLVLPTVTFPRAAVARWSYQASSGHDR